MFLIGLWEWLKLADVDDTLARTVLLVLNLLLMVLMVWAGDGSLVLYQIAALVGIGWWLLALLWLRFFTFGASPSSPARALKLLAGTLAIVPAWAALVLIHASGEQRPPVAADRAGGRLGRRFRRLFRRPHFGRTKLAPADQPQQDLGRPGRRPGRRPDRWRWASAGWPASTAATWSA